MQKCRVNNSQYVLGQDAKMPCKVLIIRQCADDVRTDLPNRIRTQRLSDYLKEIGNTQ